jgi:hypothetical protein
MSRTFPRTMPISDDTLAEANKLREASDKVGKKITWNEIIAAGTKALAPSVYDVTRFEGSPH